LLTQTTVTMLSSRSASCMLEKKIFKKYKKNSVRIKNVKNVKNVTKIKKNVKTFYIYDYSYCRDLNMFIKTMVFMPHPHAHTTPIISSC